MQENTFKLTGVTVGPGGGRKDIGGKAICGGGGGGGGYATVGSG